MKNKTLTDLKPGQKCIIVKLKSPEHMRRRLMDVGLIADTCVECIGKSPLGDPSAFLIRGAVIALREEDSRSILVKNIRSV